MVPSDWQPRPGEPHPVDEAFYKLAIKERDYERVRVDRLERQLAGAVDLLREIAESDAVDNALDPDRNRRIAAAYFAPSTTHRGQ